ncbi:MAG: ABC transporter permease [Bdellovibrionales bacterium]|nr:ABC transporter permease [Bdellovibrionales bacterium]
MSDNLMVVRTSFIQRFFQSIGVSSFQALLRSLIKSFAGAGLGLAAGLLVCYYAGEPPLKILKILYQSSFGSGYDFGMTLYYTAPLILTGLAVAIPFKAGLFNIGAEGQLTVGALAAAWAGVLGAGITSPFLAVLFAATFAFAAGGIWGAIPGFLKALRGSHEVITTIMLNFIAAGMTAYFTLYTIKDPNSAQAETIPVPESFFLKPYEVFNGAPMGNLIWFLIVLAILMHFWIWNSRWGYCLKALGENERAAETYGITKQRVWVSSMFVAGGLAGLVGLVEILGNSHKFKIGFSADWGFVGIAVALVARGNILGVLPSALLFGMLQKGAGSLDLETEKVTRDLSYLIQGLIILGVASEGLWDGLSRFLGNHLKQRARAKQTGGTK